MTKITETATSALNDDAAACYWARRLEEFRAWAEPRRRQADESIEWCEAIIRKLEEDEREQEPQEQETALSQDTGDIEANHEIDYFLTLEHFTCAVVGIESCDETIHEEYSKIKTVREFVSFAKDHPECIDESLLPEGIHVDNAIEIANDFGIFRARSA
jgi:hypothetical protein